MLCVISAFTEVMVLAILAMYGALTNAFVLAIPCSSRYVMRNLLSLVNAVISAIPLS